MSLPISKIVTLEYYSLFSGNLFFTGEIFGEIDFRHQTTGHFEHINDNLPCKDRPFCEHDNY